MKNDTDNTAGRKTQMALAAYMSGSYPSNCSACVESRDIIRQLLNAAPTGHCVDFHHGKKDQHGLHEPCPVEKRWRGAIKRAEDFVYSANAGRELPARKDVTHE